MHDLIDRKAAIDILDAYQVMVKNGEENPYTWARLRMSELQSAQPEIIRCGQCKYAEVADKEDAQDEYTCQFHRGSIWFSGSYCSWAERRTDE